MIDKTSTQLTIKQQCQLLNLNRSSYYYRRKTEAALNVTLMQLIDEQYIRTPFYGVLKMTAHLRNQGYIVNHKRIARLMRIMGIQGLHPSKHTKKGLGDSLKYPNLLRDCAVIQPDQVWVTDITYIRTARGFVYLTAIMDYFSRYVISWELSNTIDLDLCLSALDRALQQGHPEILHSDQGVQYTSPKFSEVLRDNAIQISMSGKGNVYDNILIERLWRSVKYEEIYIKESQSLKEVRQRLASYFVFYNYERMHNSLFNQTPAAVYFNNKSAAEIQSPNLLNGFGLRPPPLSNVHLNNTKILSS
jgi:putative transposase